MSEFQERTQPYFKPMEVEQRARELKRLQQTISAPPHIRSQVQDMGALVRRRNNLQRDLDANAPKPYEGEEIDAARKRRDALLATIVQGMPTQAEMRRTPPGAVDKHMEWERANKKRIREWKNIERRLRATEGDYSLDAVDISNLEKYRPRGGSSELSMDNALIPGKTFHIPENVTIKNTMSDADRLMTKLEKYRLMADQGDASAQRILDAFLSDEEGDSAAAAADDVPRDKRTGKPLTEKQIAARKAHSERLKALAAKKREERAAREAAAHKGMEE